MTLAQIREVMAEVHKRRYGKKATNEEVSHCYVTSMQMVCVGETGCYVLSLLWPTWRGDFRVNCLEGGSCIILDITRPRI